MIKAGIAGLGRWGQSLVNATKDSPNIRFVAANTRNQAAAADFCAQHKLRWTANYQDLLDDPDIDAVVLATPHTLHKDQVLKAAAAGKHIFAEKPFALTLPDAHEMMGATAKAGIVLAVGFNRRFHPSMRRLKADIQSGALGTIVTVLAEQTALHGLHMTEASWRAQPEEAPGGAMTAIGVHLVDGMIDLLGRADNVRAIVSRRAVEIADDTTNVQLRFRSGAVGQIFCSTAATPHYRFAVYGTGGMAEILGHPMATYRLVRSTEDAFRTAPPETVETPNFNMLTAELEEFAAAIVGKRAFSTPLTDILHGVEIFDAVIRSAESGAPVDLG